MFVRLSAAIAAVSLMSGAAFAAGPTDPQIAHIAYTAGTIDVAAAKQALSKTSNKDVKAFAQDMVRDHDKAYVANEVAYHKAVDNALETTLIPSASNADLKSLLETGLKIFQGHEQHAEHVASELK